MRRINESMDLPNILKPVTIKGESFVPIIKLLEYQFINLYGNSFTKELKIQKILVDHEDPPTAFRVIATLHGFRHSFTLNLSKQWKEFKHIVDGTQLQINQLGMFDKLREWGFKI